MRHLWRMSLTLRVLLALIAGLALGLPLAVSNLIVGVTSTPDPRVVGRIGARALVFFVVVVGIAAAFGVLLGAPLLALLPLAPAAVESLRAGAAASGATAAESAKSFPTFGESLIGLVPANPIKAAADQWRRSVAGLHVFHTGAVALPNDGWCRWPR